MPAISSPTIMVQPPEYIYRPIAADSLATPRQFKKHKNLPRPLGERERERERELERPDGSGHNASTDYNLVIDTSYTTSSPNSQSSSPRTLKHQSRRINSGPDLPPTPPSHSRTSSSSHSTSLQKATSLTGAVDGSLQPTPQSAPAPRKPPVTPPDQRSPPTPDVTPPKTQPAVKPLRPPPCDRSVSGTTPTESRTDSFTTAREEQTASDDEAGRVAEMRSHFGSGQTSQTTILRVPETNHNQAIHPQALDAALVKLNHTPTEPITPRTMSEFGLFDGEWPSHKQRQDDRLQEQEQDLKYQRAVTNRRKRPSPKTPVLKISPASKPDVVEDSLVAPTPAAKAVRQMQLRDGPIVDSSPVSSSVRSISETSASADARRSSATSARSSASAMVEVLVVDRPPQRQRTLRHVKKQRVLRGPSDEGEPKSSESDSLEGHKRLPQPTIVPKTTPKVGEQQRQNDRPKSNEFPSPLITGKARREVWNQGGIPVVVVPDRQSSHRGRSKEPSLRSTSSRRSKRTDSIVSSQQFVQPDGAPRSDRNVRQNSRGRAASLTRRGDERTMDYAPVVPPRSSSLSAPTSRNVSRSGSLTTESIQAHNALMQSQQKATEGKLATPAGLPVEVSWKTAHTHLPKSPTENKAGSADLQDQYLLDPDHHEDSLSMKKFSSRNTPFSIVSIDTMGTAPEVSEAQAIHMYPHQNSSVLMVDSTRPSEGSDQTPRDDDAAPALEPPIITTTGPEGKLPVTPPDQQGDTQDVDSPLRNPRVAPEPPKNLPAINFIPATPSGITPADERRLQQGNYFEVAGQGTARRPTFVRRAFSRRRHSIDAPPSSSKGPGLLTRTFSLSRHVGLGADANLRAKRTTIDGEPDHTRGEEKPADDSKLHPFWRPQYEDEEEECEFGDDCPHHFRRDGGYLRYPAIDNRPRPPKRSLSARMKHTFAILPAKERSRYTWRNSSPPDLRTIRRTPSGSLRVMPRRGSAESLRRLPDVSRDRPPPVERNRAWGLFGRSSSTHVPQTSDGRRRFSLSGRLDDLSNIPHMLNERRREKRTQELRQMISAPTEVRDGVGEVIRHRGIQAS